MPNCARPVSTSSLLVARNVLRCYRIAWLTFNLIILRKSYKNYPWLNSSRRIIRIILERSFNQKWKDTCARLTNIGSNSESTEKVERLFLYFLFNVDLFGLSLRVIEITTKWLAIILHERRNICRHLKKWFAVGLEIVWFDFSFLWFNWLCLDVLSQLWKLF